jgi:hypothetical protein
MDTARFSKMKATVLSMNAKLPLEGSKFATIY